MLCVLSCAAVSVPKLPTEFPLGLVKQFNVRLWTALRLVIKCLALPESYPKADLSISLEVSVCHVLCWFAGSVELTLGHIHIYTHTYT